MYFGERIHNQVRSELSHIAMNWVWEEVCSLAGVRETVLCIWLSLLVVLKSVVRNPHRVLHVYLTDVWDSSFCQWEKKPPPHTLFLSGLVSFESWGKRFLSNRPYSLVPLWLYNVIYLDIVSLSGFIQTLLNNSYPIFSVGDLKNWFMVVWVLSLRHPCLKAWSCFVVRGCRCSRF